MALDSTVKVKFLGDAANLAREAARASKATDQVGKSAENAHTHLMRMAKGVALGAAFGTAVAGVEKFAHSSVNAFKDAAAEASKLNRVTGLTAEQASRLGFAAKETGQDSENFAKALGLLSKNLNNADKQQTQLVKTSHLAVVQVPKLVKGHLEYAFQLKTVTDVQKKLVPSTQSLGFALRDASGHLLPMATLLPEIADKFKAMQNGPEKTALALKLFGRGGAQLLPFLNQGAAGLAKFGEEADKLGITMSGKDVTAYRQYVAAQREFHAAMEGVKITLGRELFPLFTAWSHALADNAPQINEFARKFVQDLVPAIQSTVRGFASLLKGLHDGTGAGGEIKRMAETAATSLHQLAAVFRVVKSVAEDFAYGFLLVARGVLDIAGVVAKVSDKLFHTHLSESVDAGISKIRELQAQIEASKAGATIPINIVVTTTNRTALDPATHAKGFIGPTVAEGLAASGVAGPYTPKQTGASAVAAAAVAAAGVLHATQVRLAAAAKAANDKVLQGQLDQAAAAQRAADAKQAAADALQKASDAMRQALTDRLETAKGIRDSLVNSNSVVRDGLSWTAKDLLSRFRTQMDKVRRFSAAIQEMVRKGYSATIVRQVADAGVQGGMGTAVGLAHASASQVAQFNAVQGGIDRAAGYAGGSVAGQMGPIQIVTKVMLNDRELATAVNNWNRQAAATGHR